MKKLAVGLLGCGDVSDIYFQNCARLDALSVVACASLHIEKARAKAAKYSVPRVCTVDQLIKAPEVEVVLNLTSPKVHAELNLVALTAGKHVYTEKPLASTLVEGAEILALARSRGLRVGSAPDTFLGARLQACRRALDSGLVGEPVGAAAFVVSPGHEWHHPNPEFFYKPGGGPVLDMGPYYLTALIALLGPVKKVSGFARTSFPRRTIQTAPRKGQTVAVEVATHVAGTLQFENGAVGTMIASFDVWDSELPRIEIYGTRGTLCIRDVDPLLGPNIFGGQVLVRTADKARWRGIPRPAGLEEWDRLPAGNAWTENSRGLGLADMAYAIRNGRPHRASGELAYHMLEVSLALLEAAEKGTTVTIASTCERPAPLPEDFPAGE